MQAPVARRHPLPVVVLLTATVALLLAGCGGGDSSSSTQSSSGGGGGEASGAVAGDEAAVAKYTRTQAPIKIPPLGEAPAKGKHLAFMTCAAAACVAAIKGAEEGAEALGWTWDKFNNPFTPEGYAAAWNEIIQSRPDGVVYIGVLPNELIEKQLAQLKELEIPVMGISVARISPTQGALTPGGPIYGAFAAIPTFELSGQLMAQIIIADHGGAPDKAVLAWDKTKEANLGVVREEFEKTVADAGSETELLEVNFEQEGKGIPSLVVSYLQRNPEVEYLALVASEYTTGVAAAIKAAGLTDQVKLITRVPVAANVDEIKNGEMFAAVAEEDSSLGWRAINGLVQRFAGKDDYEAEPVGWHQIINADNIEGFELDSLGSPAVPGVPKVFLEAWGMEGE